MTVEVDKRIAVVPVFPTGMADLSGGKLNFRSKTWSDGDMFSGGGFQNDEGSTSAPSTESPIPAECLQSPVFFLTG